MGKTINSVDFDQNGFRGMTVKYLTVESSGAFSYPNEYRKKCMAPVHTELKRAMEPFIARALNICHLNRDKQYEAELVSVHKKNESFTISVKCKSDLAGGWYAVSTPLLTEGDYGGYDAMLREWEKLAQETLMYVDNTASATNRQLVMEFAQEQVKFAKTDEEKEEFKGYEKDVKKMTEDELLEEARQIVEKRGGVMYTPEDLGLPAQESPKAGKKQQMKLQRADGADEEAEGF